VKDVLLEFLRCPACAAVFDLVGARREHGLIRQGRLECTRCTAVHAIEGYVPRLVASSNYADSFGFQWNTHAQTQIDERRANDLSDQRFFGTTRWPRDLRGLRLLEAGSGAGRFTAIAVRTGATVFSFDYSSAVNANYANNGEAANLHLVQADIYHVPFAPNTFDKVVCLGVLQHCPDPWRAFRSLVAQLAPGGEIVVDVYSRTMRSLLHPKFWLRPIAQRLSSRQLYRIVERAVPVLLPVKRWLVDDVPMGEYFGYFVPVAYQREWRGREFDDAYLNELSVLDTFDWYSPAHDHPQTLTTVRKWFTRAQLENIEVSYGPNGIIGRGSRP